MIKIKIIAMGKLKEDYLRSALAEYKKRLSRFCSFEIAELSPVVLPDKPSKSQIETALLKECELIEKSLPKDSYVFSLCIEGKQLTSEEFSEKFADLSSKGKNICFIVGSSYGLSERIKEKSDFKLSLSKMTFPHQLFRVMISEQIYRAFMINEGSTYHK